MSQWTHVNASIRFDGLLGMGLPTEKELGRICRWEDEDTSHWDNSELPCGSEGSIEYKAVTTGGENSLACMVIVFAGDLRDYEDTDAILKYFTKLTDGKMIRSGILEIDVEYKDTKIYTHDSEKKEWVLKK